MTFRRTHVLLAGAVVGVIGLFSFFAVAGRIDADVAGYTLRATGGSNFVTVSFTAPNNGTTQSDWIGIYTPGSPDNSFLAWQYVPSTNTSGSFSFSNLSPGTYQARYFSNNGYTRLAASNQFSVGGSGGSGTTTGSYRVRFTDTTLAVGQTATIAWNAPQNGSTQDWVGLFRSGSADTAYVSWQYVSGTAGSVSLQTNGEGTYQARYFKDNGFGRVAVSSNQLTVGTQGGGNDGTYSLIVAATGTRPVGSTITVNWRAPSNANLSQDWIALYQTGASNNSYIAWQYAGTPSGAATFTLQNAGTYEIRYLKNNGFTSVAKSRTITVGTNTGGGNNGQYRLTTSANQSNGAGRITVNWTAPSSDNLSQDWIALYSRGADDRSYITWQYAGTPSGSLSFTVSTAGTYDVRYFKNNGFIRVAISNAIPVTIGGSGGDNGITNFPSRGQNVIAFGDSLTAGVGASSGMSYPAQLSRILGVPIINAGVSGNTTEDALNRLNSAVLSQNPKVVLVLLGGNDELRRLYEELQGIGNDNMGDEIRDILIRIGANVNGTALTRDKTFDNLREIITRIQSTGAITVVVGLGGGIFSPSLNNKYADLARETRSAYVPEILRDILGRPSLLSDLVHPNDEGYGIMASRIAPVVRPLLANPT